MLAFMKNLIGVKMDKAASAGIEAIVRWDPKSASEAEMRTMEQRLDELGREVALARQSFDKEEREAEAIQTLSQQRMAAAELLQRQIDAESDPARRTALEKSLETLVSMLEQMAPEIEREKSEAADAMDYLTMLEQTYAEAGASSKPHAPSSSGHSATWRARRSSANRQIARRKRRAGQQGSPARPAA